MRINIIGEIGTGTGQYSHANFRSAIDKMAADDKELILYTSGPGGDMNEADLMYSDILELRSKGVVVNGIVASEMSSAYSYLMQACDTREGYHHIKGVVHNAIMSNVSGNYQKLEQAAQAAKAWSTGMAEIYAKRTGKTAEEWLAIMDMEKSWSAKELVELGLLDGIIEPAKAAALSAEIEQTDNQFFKNMTNTADAIVAKAKSQLRAFAQFMGVAPKALSVELADGSKIWVETEDGELEGKVAYTTDSEGNPTSDFAPVGTHDLIDGRKITVGEGGVITAVELNEMDALKNEIAALKAENESLTALVGEATEANAKLLAEVQAAKTAVTSTKVTAARTTTTPKAVAKNQATDPAEKTVDIVGAYASLKGISREDAERAIERNKSNNNQ